MANSTSVVRGTAISASQGESLEALQSIFKPEAGLKRLEDFAKFIFASVAIVGTLGAAFSNAAFGELGPRGKLLFALALGAISASVASAAMSLSPKWVVANPHNHASMEEALARAYRARRLPLQVATVTFLMALLFASAAPIVSGWLERQPPLAQMTYAWTHSGELATHLVMTGLEPFSVVRARIRGRAVKAGPILLPQAMTMADRHGDASVALTLKRLTPGSSKMAFVATWSDPSTPDETTRKVLKLPRRPTGRIDVRPKEGAND